MTQAKSNDKLPPIEDRKGLIAALKDTAELEHQFMCIYLYAAFSLKKNPDASCNAAQLEAVRRWTSAIYKIARQEMEHLSLVNSMLAAIGAPPHFSRQNIPIQSPHYKPQILIKRYGLGDPQQETPSDSKIPCEFPFIFEPFDLCSAKRYACMESPKCSYLSEEQQQQVAQWCFQDSKGNCPCLPNFRAGNGLELHRSYSLNYIKSKQGSAANGVSAVNEVEIGTIEELYQRLREGFIAVAEEDKSLFVGRWNQHQVQILSEYDIYTFPVTDLTSALNAIDLIVKQGEGINAPPYFDSHFLNFYDIVQEYEKLSLDDRSFVPTLRVPHNPKQEDITNKLTKHIFDLFNYSYVTLLYVLTGLYGWYQPASEETTYPHFSAALREIAFAPAMTMLIRSLGEVLVQLPIKNDPKQAAAAPDFHILLAVELIGLIGEGFEVLENLLEAFQIEPNVGVIFILGI